METLFVIKVLQLLLFSDHYKDVVAWNQLFNNVIFKKHSKLCGLKCFYIKYTQGVRFVIQDSN